MAKNELDLEDLLGLTDKTISIELDVKNKPQKGTLEYDLYNLLGDSDNKYMEQLQAQKDEEENFMRLFKACFPQIISVFQHDPAQHIAVNCAGCRWSNNFVGNGYGKAKTIRNSTNGKNPNK